MRSIATHELNFDGFTTRHPMEKVHYSQFPGSIHIESGHQADRLYYRVDCRRVIKIEYGWEANSVLLLHDDVADRHAVRTCAAVSKHECAGGRHFQIHLRLRSKRCPKPPFVR